MQEAIAGDDPVTTGWLTAILGGADVLPNGDVATVEEQPNTTAFNSIITHLTLTYSPDAPPDAPRRLLLKRNLSATWAIEDAKREVGFCRLARQIRAIIAERKLTQMQAGTLLELAQPNVSNLLNGRLKGFSVEKLMGIPDRTRSQCADRRHSHGKRPNTRRNYRCDPITERR